MFEQLADFIIYQLFNLSPHSKIAETAHFFVMDVSKIFAMLVVIVYIMGLFDY